MLKLLRTCHRPACQTLSNAFLKFLKCGTDRAGVVGLYLYDCSTTENMFYCALAWSKTRLFLSLAFESVEDNLEYAHAGMADQVDGCLSLVKL